MRNLIFMPSKEESEIVSHVRFLCRTEAELSMESFITSRPGPKVIKLFSCSTQLSIKFVLVINLKLRTVANSFFLNLAEHENFSAKNMKMPTICWHFHIY